RPKRHRGIGWMLGARPPEVFRITRILSPECRLDHAPTAAPLSHRVPAPRSESRAPVAPGRSRPSKPTDRAAVGTRAPSAQSQRPASAAKPAGFSHGLRAGPVDFATGVLE